MMRLATLSIVTNGFVRGTFFMVPIWKLRAILVQLFKKCVRGRLGVLSIYRIRARREMVLIISFRGRFYMFPIKIFRARLNSLNKKHMRAIDHMIYFALLRALSSILFMICLRGCRTMFPIPSFRGIRGMFPIKFFRARPELIFTGGLAFQPSGVEDSH